MLSKMTCPWCMGKNTQCDVNSTRRDSNGVWRCRVWCSDCKNNLGFKGVATSEHELCPHTPVGAPDHITPIPQIITNTH